MFEVLVSRQLRQTFSDIVSAIDYAARHVYLPWNNGQYGKYLLEQGQEFSYQYGFETVTIKPIDPITEYYSDKSRPGQPPAMPRR